MKKEKIETKGLRKVAICGWCSKINKYPSTQPFGEWKYYSKHKSWFCSEKCLGEQLERWNKQKRKDSWFSDFIATTLIVVLIVIVIWLFMNGGYDDDSPRWCENNPDKCVCEENLIPNKEYDYLYQCKGDFNIYSKNPLECNNRDFERIIECRKKTQAELDSDDCNSNPREGDLCKCEEEYKLECLNKGVYNFEKNNISFIIQLQPNLTEMKYHSYCYPKPKVIEESGATLKEVIYEDIWIAKQRCLKSRPKTEYEKHPEDYAAECNQDAILKNTSFGMRCQDCGKEKCDFSKSGGGALLEPTYRLKNECEKGNPDWVEEQKLVDCLEWENEREYKRQQPDTYRIYGLPCKVQKFETICREKTEVEKLMDKDCEDISQRMDDTPCHFSIKYSNSYGILNFPQPQRCINLKQAWRQKGCPI